MSGSTSGGVVSLLPGGNRHGVITADDRSVVLNIEAIFLLVTAILSISVRLAIRFGTTHIPGMDDAVALLSLVSRGLRMST